MEESLSDAFCDFIIGITKSKYSADHYSHPVLEVNFLFDIKRRLLLEVNVFLTPTKKILEVRLLFDVRHQKIV